MNIHHIRKTYSEVDGAARQLSAVLEEIAEVRSLIEDLRQAISSSEKNFSPKNAQYILKNKAQQGSSKQDSSLVIVANHTDVDQVSTNQHMNQQMVQADSIVSLLSIAEIPDVSPSDSVYAPLRVLIEDWGHQCDSILW
ncbi:MAG: hypothetical protein AAFQ63_04415 [Cyanobacteria bacterium J06621_11]